MEFDVYKNAQGQIFLYEENNETPKPGLTYIGKALVTMKIDTGWPAPRK